MTAGARAFRTPAATAGGEGFAALTWTHFLNDLLQAYVPGVLPFLALEHHIPLALAGALMTMVVIGQALQPLAGLWADRTGGRSFILAGPAIAAVGTIGLSIAPSYGLLAAALLFTGLGGTLFHPQALTAVRTILARRQGTGMSGFLIGGEVGRALGPVAAGALVAAWGMGHIWLLAVPLAVSAPWVWRTFPVLPARDRAAPRIAWRRHLGPMTALTAYATCRSVAVYAITTFLPILWYERGGSLVASASLATTLIGIGVIGNFTGGAAADKLGRRPVLLGAAVASALLLAVLLQVGGLWLWPVLGAVGVALFSTSPLTILIGQDVFVENPAVGSGVALGLSNGLGALLIIPLGLVSARWGIDAALWVAIALLLASLSCVGPLAPRSPAASGSRPA